MSKKLTRREFVHTSTTASLALGAAPVFGQAPAMRTAGSKPVVIASDNGNVYKNGGTKTGVQLAFEMMTSGGKDVLDALVAGVNLPELDPEESGVGYGGLPNADGVVQLDSCCMHGPAKRAGGVAAIEGFVAGFREVFTRDPDIADGRRAGIQDVAVAIERHDVGFTRVAELRRRPVQFVLRIRHRFFLDGHLGLGPLDTAGIARAAAKSDRDERHPDH
jgi:hypothetical protein